MTLKQKAELTLPEQIMEMQNALELVVCIDDGKDGDFMTLHDAERIGGQGIPAYG